MTRKVIIIGGGVGGLATACLLGKAGYQVTVLEKNEQLGGRAGQLRTHGFTFDTGPSWYLMPDVFERFFALLGERLEDHLQLQRLTPSYRVFYPDGKLDITDNLAHNMAATEKRERGAGESLQRYLASAQKTYHTIVDNFLYENYEKPGQLLGRNMWRARCLPLQDSLQSQAARYFHSVPLRQLIVLPSLFLGTKAERTPAIYSMLNHSLFTGVDYPLGGMYELVRALERIGKKCGVDFRTNATVEKIIVTDRQAKGVIVDGKKLPADVVISNAGLHHTETAFLEPASRDHSARYWRRRTWAPSALLLYLGIDRRYPSLAHHNLLVSDNWQRNMTEIFDGRHLPQHASLYICAPSRTDPAVAPKGCENIFILAPIAAGVRYTPAELQRFENDVLRQMEEKLHLKNLGKHIVFQKSFAADDFAERFNSPHGSALGLSHTLGQSALFRPSNASKKVHGLYYVGADVQPGIGLPAVLISAQLVARRLLPAEDTEGDDINNHQPAAQ